jgi:hypothetical protein
MAWKIPPSMEWMFWPIGFEPMRFTAMAADTVIRFTATEPAFKVVPLSMRFAVR